MSADEEHDLNWDLSKVRPVTKLLVEAIIMDVYPSSPAVLTDFGIESQRHYEAIYYPLRSGEISPMLLEDALGSGPKLTGLVNAARSNPHKGIEFKTSWDELLPEPWPAPAPRPSLVVAKGRDFDMDR